MAKIVLQKIPDARAYITLSEAIAAAGVSGGTIHIVEPVTLDQNATVSGCTIKVTEPGYINLGNFNLTFDNTSRFDCPYNYQAFYYTGTGVVTFASEAVPYVAVKWFPDFSNAVSAGSTILLSSSATLAANYAGGAGKHLIILKGGSIISATYTFEWTGTLDAGNYQVFSGFGAGDLTLDIEYVYPQWIGTISEAVTALGSSETTLKVNTSIDASDTAEVVTIPTNLSVQPVRGGVISKGTATGLTINGPVVGDPKHQWLSGFNSTQITFLGGTIYAEWFGAKGDGVTDDAVALQLALSIVNLRLNATCLKLNKRIYRSDAKLTMISAETGGSRHSNVRIIKGNGAILDFSQSGITGTISSYTRNPLLNIGTAVNTAAPASPECIIEQGLLKVSDLKIIGPEIRRPDIPNGTAPLTATVGIRLQTATDADLENIDVTDCTIGYETKDSFPVHTRNLKARNCWIGAFVNGGSTIGTWVGLSTVQCAYGVILQSALLASAPVYGFAASVSNQTFISHRVENCWYSYIISPVDAAMKNIRIIDTYGEDTLYDAVNSGFVFNLDYIHIPSSTLITPTSIYVAVDRLHFYPSKLQFNAAGGSYYLFKAPLLADANHVHCRMTFPTIQGNDIHGVLISSIVEYLGADTGDAGGIRITDSSGYPVYYLNAHTKELYMPAKLSLLGTFIYAGEGSPEGALAAPVGSLYLRTDGGTGFTFHVKETGTGSTGWVAK